MLLGLRKTGRQHSQIRAERQRSETLVESIDTSINAPESLPKYLQGRPDVIQALAMSLKLRRQNRP